ncbi:class I SAM-dependent methyltransferase [Halomonas sp. 7T]|uniref:class I SAM-dependent methyltransferase n=1 Tax=unclassified Halomonas TaxID=2609666 RepID=UPI0009F6428C|nr:MULTISPECIES: class I SAM-dependent methyltransferase [unclassified Halomonas]UXZ53964.1 class I SAM-dependent methyltransferase [Halomonas sp. 7T]
MNSKHHWESVYQRKSADQVSWFRPHLEASLDYIQSAAPDPHTAIIDVGCGEATLVDDLLALGYDDITVLDISESAIEAAQRRLADVSSRVKWRVGDITQARLPGHYYAVWHDRAVFHFLVDPVSRAAYLLQLRHSLVPGGHVVMATFGPEGPTRCSGLDVVRYSASQLSEQLGPSFELLSDHLEVHETPTGSPQQFLYTHFRHKDGKGGEVTECSSSRR